jgi:hypothetical protein
METILGPREREEELQSGILQHTSFCLSGCCWPLLMGNYLWVLSREKKKKKKSEVVPRPGRKTRAELKQEKRDTNRVGVGGEGP